MNAFNYSFTNETLHQISVRVISSFMYGQAIKALAPPPPLELNDNFFLSSKSFFPLKFLPLPPFLNGLAIRGAYFFGGFPKGVQIKIILS